MVHAHFILNNLISMDGSSPNYCYFYFQIIVQAIVSLFAVMWGVLNVAGNLREIHAAAELNTVKWETQKNLPSFYIFNHRGKALASNYVPSNAAKSDLENLE